MCEAIGINENHKLYYVHLGHLKFKHRHFLTMVDNTLVDVSGMQWSPWGHAFFGNFEVYNFTEYPYFSMPMHYG